MTRTAHARSTSPSPLVDIRAARRLRWALNLIPSQAVVPILRGPMRGQRWVVGAGLHSCWLGTFEPAKQRMLVGLLKPGDIVYDVGAHAGLYTLLASRRVGPSGRVVAFEPVPRNLAFLERHVSLNRLTNVTVVAAAVSSASGRADFRTQADTYTGRLAADGDLRVKEIALDDLEPRSKFLPPVLIKIDVEGGEADVIRGSLRSLATGRPTLLLSTHGERQAQECTRLLGRAGYRVAPVGGDPMELLCTPEPV